MNYFLRALLLEHPPSVADYRDTSPETGEGGNFYFFGRRKIVAE